MCVCVGGGLVIILMGEGDARFDPILSLAPCVNHATYLLRHHSIKRIGSSRATCTAPPAVYGADV